MKGYLFGLGAMLVGAGLMFVLMHGEVMADNKEVPEPFVCSKFTRVSLLPADKKLGTRVEAVATEFIWHCQAANVSCGLTLAGAKLDGGGSATISCVNTKSGLFK